MFLPTAQQRLHPDKKMCVIFDMEGAGLSNMDMNLIRFVVNCFKIYFPNLLGQLGEGIREGRDFPPH